RRRRSDDEHRQQHSCDTHADQKAQSCHAAMPTTQALTMLLNNPAISEQISLQVMRLLYFNGAGLMASDPGLIAPVSSYSCHVSGLPRQYRNDQDQS
ncbi:MAG: hypothetical protein U0995_15200, partial [Erythrobacter sp.]|nr:hypothetical protein [Erythrobacter sp.]